MVILKPLRSGGAAKAVVPILMLLCSRSFGFVVALDCYHNNEPTPHYTWEQTGQGGFSQFGDVLKGLGTTLTGIRAELTANALSGVDMLIIVDPDTPAESPSPRYITAAEAGAVQSWVNGGGMLLLLGNDAGNAEFVNFNGLAGRFGIAFNSDTYSGGPVLGQLPVHPFFAGCAALHIVGQSTLSLSAPAEAVYSANGSKLFSSAVVGKGAVVAVGDPWVYNEYINTQDNRRAITNVCHWMMDRKQQSTRVIRTGLREQAAPASASDCCLIMGRIAWPMAQNGLPQVRTFGLTGRAHLTPTRGPQ